MRLDLDWSGQAIQTSLSREQLAQLRDLHRQAWKPGREPAVIGTIAPVLGRLLGLPRPQPESLLHCNRIELCAAGPLATEVIWGMAAVDPSQGLHGDPETLFNATLASTPLVRVLPSEVVEPTFGDYRPTMLWCVTNARIKGHRLDLSQFRDVYERLRERWSLFRMEWAPRVEKDTPTWPEVRAEIGRRAPQILVVVGHGSSSPRGREPAEPSVLFRSPTARTAEWVPVRRIAEAIRRTGSVSLAIFVCCDLVREGGNFAGRRPATYSAASALIVAGAPQLVAMQAPIRTEAASAFLHGFLADWLQGFRPETATLAGRRAAVESEEAGYAWLPTLFSSQSALGSTAARDQDQRFRVSLMKTVQPPAIPAGYLKRDTLARDLCTKLTQTGVLQIRAGSGFGCTSLLGEVLRSFPVSDLGRGVRPALYLDCAEPAEGDNTGIHVATRFANVRDSHPLLFPSDFGSPVPFPDEIAQGHPRQLGVDIAQAVQHADVTLIFDNTQSARDEDDRLFWEGLLAQAYGGQQGLVVVAGAAATLAGDVEKHELEIPPFNESEVEEYLKQAMPALAPCHEDVFRLCDGTPRILGEARRHYEQYGRDAAMGTLESANLCYLNLLLARLSVDARRLLCRLSGSGCSIPVDVAEDHLLWDMSSDARKECVDSEAVRERREDDRVLWRVPDFLRGSIMTHLRSEAEQQFDEVIDRWAPPGESGDDKLHALLAQPGGMSVVQHVAECHARVEEYEAVLFMALTVARDSRAPALDRYRFARHATKWLPEGDPELPALRLKVAQRALDIGRVDEARGQLVSLPSGLPADTEVEAILTEARWLKEAEQHQGIPKAVAKLAQALDVVEQQIDTSPEPDYWRRQRWDVRYEQLKLAAFFHADVGIDLTALRTDLLENAPNEGERAKLLATFAEAEMDKADVDWESVARWAVEANGLAQDESVPCPDRTFCMYQYARYLDRRGHEEAAAQYELAEERAKKEEQPARFGLARFHRIKLKREASPAATAAQRNGWISKIDEALTRIRQTASGAHAGRASARLYELRADLSRELHDTARELESLERAVRILTLPSIVAHSDRVQLLRLLDRFLARVETVRDGFRRFQSLASDVRCAVEERFHVQLPLDDLNRSRRLVWETLQAVVEPEHIGENHG